ncbi:MAG: DMT family protein [Nevskiaceae bacterium]
MSLPQLLVPLLIFVSGAFMAVAWLGHLRIREYGFWVALLMSWAIVPPEYVLGETRQGHQFVGMALLAVGMVLVLWQTPTLAPA